MAVMVIVTEKYLKITDTCSKVKLEQFCPIVTSYNYLNPYPAGTESN